MELQGMATEIKSLGQGMATSYLDRKNTIDVLRDEVHQMLKTSQKELMEQKTELDETLDIFQKNLQKEIHRLLKDYSPARRKILNNEMLASLQDNIQNIRKENVLARKDLHKLMESFHKEHRERRNEVGLLADAVKDMWSGMARVRGNAKRAATHIRTEQATGKITGRSKRRSKKA